ncbi:hypothetical protein [Pontibacter chitinilyticus]|uniref:hypothetical protein n=1 Tax=Pontibacter chitinilyticus TaxID=2674989 RepID=UPI00321AF59E
MLQLYYKTEFIRVSYEEEWQLGVAEWNGFVSSGELRKAALNSLNFVHEKNITRWLADRRKMRAIRQQDQQWTVEEFIPKMMASPLRRLATVISEDMFNKMALEQIIRRSSGFGDIALRDFDNFAAAMAWLKTPLSENAAPNTLLPINDNENINKRILLLFIFLD